VAEAVVDRLESVQIAEEQPSEAPWSPAQYVVEALPSDLPVGQAGEGITAGLAAKLMIEPGVLQRRAEVTGKDRGDLDHVGPIRPRSAAGCVEESDRLCVHENRNT
jgi:hypothetical protein